MRLFIAVNFDNTVKKYIGGIENKIKGFVKSGNFVDEENIHLTVRFIGEADSDELESLCIAMNEACSSFKGFKMALNGIGFFPRGNKSIVWAGIEECRPLGILYSRLEKSLQRQGFGRNRQGLSPHITLAREAVLRKSYDEVKREAAFERLEINVESITLMESRREGSKLIYVPRYVQKLK